MQSETLNWSGSSWRRAALNLSRADAVIYFGSRAMLADGAAHQSLQKIFPGAHLLGCSTGGQISRDDVHDNEVSAVAMSFAATKVRMARASIAVMGDSVSCGTSIGEQLSAPDLTAIFVLSDGLKVNGSELAAGILNATPAGVVLSGGLAGDGASFAETLVGAGHVPQPGVVGAIGLYGSAVRIGTGSVGGWDVFGPRRTITASAGNVLHALDGEPALDLYERYLGEDDAKALPGSGLLFPLRISDPLRPESEIVRTILAIDRDKRSMTFAGDVPQGWTAQLMRGKHDRLTAGAAEAARMARARLGEDASNGVALMISCIGRRLLMGQRVNDEVEAAAAELGAAMKRIGFYSYGELSPHEKSGFCELHNQTMTITTISEAA